MIASEDAGLDNTALVLAMAHKESRGGDTAMVIAPQLSNRIFDLQIREILTKPFDW